MTTIQVRRGVAAKWTANNPTLAVGEIGFETDTSKFKIGNGSTVWSVLPYFFSGETSGTPGSLSLGNNLEATSGTAPWSGTASITVNLKSNLTGVNASTATALATSRTINGTAFNGSADVSVPGAIYGSGFRNVYVSQTQPTGTFAIGDVWISW